MSVEIKISELRYPVHVILKDGILLTNNNAPYSVVFQFLKTHYHKALARWVNVRENCKTCGGTRRSWLFPLCSLVTLDQNMKREAFFLKLFQTCEISTSISIGVTIRTRMFPLCNKEMYKATFAHAVRLATISLQVAHACAYVYLTSLLKYAS